MQRWEYTTVQILRNPNDESGRWIILKGGEDIDQPLGLYLNALGGAGWELISPLPFAWMDNRMVAYDLWFKRQLPEE